MLGLRPASRALVAHDELRVGQRPELVDALVEEVLLIELIEQREAALEPSELPEILEDAQAYRVERAKVHLVQVELDAQLAQSVGDAGRQLARSLIGERNDEQRLRGDVHMHYQVDDSLNERESLARTRPRDNKNGAIRRMNGLKLLRIGLCN